MLLPGCHIVRTCLFFTVLIAAVISYPYPEDEKKTFNLKIGFDLTQGENGAPKLLVRDFEDSKEINQRATDSDAHKSGEDADQNLKGKVSRKSKVSRAVSSKSSEESVEEVAKPKEKARSSEEDNSKEADGGDKRPAPVPSPPPPRPNRSKSDEDDDGESDMDNKHSTKGLGADDFEADEKTARKDNDDEDGRRRRRSKRAAKIFKKYYNESKLKRKHKKVNQASFKPKRTTPTIF